LDVLPLGNRRHTAATLALEIAQRIDEHTTERQFLYGATTDNGKNVVLAAKKIILQYNLLLANNKSFVS